MTLHECLWEGRSGSEGVGRRSMGPGTEGTTGKERERTNLRKEDDVKTVSDSSVALDRVAPLYEL